MNGDQLLRVHDLLTEAEKLASETCRHETVDPRLARLYALLWLGRDLAVELVEDVIGRTRRPVGRAERPHT